MSGLAQFTNANVLNELISYNKEFIIPIMTRYGKLWSNFWGSIGNGTLTFPYLTHMQLKFSNLETSRSWVGKSLKVSVGKIQWELSKGTAV